MTILVATNKYETNYYRFSTELEQKESVLKLFKTNNELEYYTDIEDDKAQYELYKKALKGDSLSAWRLLKLRKGYEYEEFSVEKVK